MAELDQYVKSYRDGELTGKELADMVESGSLTKTERRKIVKLSARPIKIITPLTDRQILRLAVKEKKSMPKLSKEDRRTKFTASLAQEKDKEREQEAANFTTCLGCRKRGHFLKDCPKVNKNSAADAAVDICFNCGLSGHALRHCLKHRNKDGSLPFASCFICMKKGHISKDCPENPNGLYPKGGCCHICLQKTHLVRDCPERTEEDRLNHVTKKQREAQEAEDISEGPRIGAMMPESGGGDDMDDSYFADTADQDDEEEDKEPKSKKSRRSEGSSSKKRKS
jgi:Zinc knuckle